MAEHDVVITVFISSDLPFKWGWVWVICPLIGVSLINNYEVGNFHYKVLPQRMSVTVPWKVVRNTSTDRSESI